MEQTGEYRIGVSRDLVWAKLNDPQVLARCIEGCESMEQRAEDRFDARVKAKVGPVRATFTCEISLADIVPPHSYTLNANVKGGPAGFARGAARVNLTEDGDGTRLAYQVTAQIGGKLAQVGSRLIDGAARKMADDFFSAFRRELGDDPLLEEGLAGDGATGTGNSASQAATEPAAGGVERRTAPARRFESSGRWMVWVTAFVVLLLALAFAL